MRPPLFLSAVVLLLACTASLGSAPACGSARPAADGCDGPARAAHRVSRGELPQRFAGFAEEIRSFVKKHRVPGMAVAVSRQGDVVLSRCYGYADTATGEAVQPTSRFRIASLSKPITAVAILQLCEQKQLQLDTPVFSVLDYEAAIAAAGDDFEPRL